VRGVEFLAVLSLLGGLITFLISLPLVYRKVPKNNFYGVRLKASFASDQSWYDINAYGGKQLAFWSWPLVLVGVIGFCIPPEDAIVPFYGAAILAAALVSMILPLSRILRYARQYPPV